MRLGLLARRRPIRETVVGRQQSQRQGLVQAAEIGHPSGDQLRHPQQHSRAVLHQHPIAAGVVQLLVNPIFAVDHQSRRRRKAQPLGVLPACGQLHFSAVQAIRPAERRQQVRTALVRKRSCQNGHFAHGRNRRDGCKQGFGRLPGQHRGQRHSRVGVILLVQPIGDLLKPASWAADHVADRSNHFGQLRGRDRFLGIRFADQRPHGRPHRHLDALDVPFDLLAQRPPSRCNRRESGRRARAGKLLVGARILGSELDQPVRQQRQLGRHRTAQRPQQLPLGLRQFRDLQGGFRQCVHPILQLAAHLLAVRVKRLAAGQSLGKLDAHHGANRLEDNTLFPRQFRVPRLVLAGMLGHVDQCVRDASVTHPLARSPAVDHDPWPFAAEDQGAQQRDDPIGNPKRRLDQLGEQLRERPVARGLEVRQDRAQRFERCVLVDGGQVPLAAERILPQQPVFNQHPVHDGRLLGRILEPKIFGLVLDAFVELQNALHHIRDRPAERSRLPFVVAPTAHPDLLRKLLFQVFCDRGRQLVP